MEPQVHDHLPAGPYGGSSKGSQSTPWRIGSTTTCPEGPVFRKAESDSVFSSKTSLESKGKWP
eukprot:CAMPEP_0196653934 /NCGR_PEP_ID=MMETSP1086-20130531/3604_1 /TAXON_ID=77921 /ORGANISM="Cyanoptyche  gloeocystis , Strain SAG4.97" /LENGTH=62 /DNA_ID=CAMNT_0041985387 /DNA_START=76 /DNA_END=261 /DNA_ORIENTATION=-